MECRGDGGGVFLFALYVFFFFFFFFSFYWKKERGQPFVVAVLGVLEEL